MKRLIVTTLLCLGVSACFSFAASPADIATHASCAYCGMDREKFAHSRMLIEYDSGARVGTCSLHCAAVDLANNIDKIPTAIRVGDYSSKKLIDAEKAQWVVIAGKPGVMTRNAKWAFEDQQIARDFVAKQGGVLVSFENAIKASYEDLYLDTKQIRERRTMKRGHK